jgi:hypothetical protein
MKNVVKFNGMFLMTLIFTVALFSLAVSPLSAQTELEGAWTYSNPDSNEATWTFSGNSFTYKAGGKVEYEGTFTVKNKNMTLTLSDGGELTAAYAIIANNVVLDLKQPKAKKGTTNYSGLYGYFLNKEALQAALDEYKSIAPDSTPTVFEGTWRNLNSPQRATFTFSGNSFTYTQQGQESVKGRIVFDKKNITFIAEDGYYKWITTYTASKTQLDFKQGKGYFGWYGPFDKQK